MMKNVSAVLFFLLFTIQTVVGADVCDNAKVSIEKCANGTIYSVTEISNTYNFDSARYTVFVPDGISKLYAAFIHQHGCTMEGRGASSAYDLQYQAFAKKWKMIIVAPDLYSSKGNCHDWRDVSSGSGESLLRAMKEIGTIAHHSELANLPWLIWGHSGGGYWALSMLQTYPNRILAVFGYSPAFEPGAYPPEALKVPVFMRHAGPLGDICCWWTSIKEFGKLRSAGGLAAIAFTNYQSHNFSFVRYMAIPFFEAVLKQRLSLDGKLGYENMRAINPKQAWLGDTTSYNIYPISGYPNDVLAASWLPDSLTAAKWREYVITGTVIDHTPPPAPNHTHLYRRHNVVVEVSWRADADIESGISHFNIYKGDQLLSRFPASGEYQRFDTNGDDTYPLRAPKLNVDVIYPIGDTSVLSVTTVNHFGLESEHALVPKEVVRP